MPSTSIGSIIGGITGLGVRDPISGAVNQSMGPVILKRHDRLPALTVQLFGCPVDPSGGTVKFLMRAKGSGTAKVNAAASFVGTPTVSNCVVTYGWQAADVDTSGEFEAEFELTVGGITTTFPNTGYLGITIMDDIA